MTPAPVQSSPRPTDELTWGEAVARHLLDQATCPICQGDLAEGWCPTCGSDLRGPVGSELWRASLTAAGAMRARDAVLQRIPSVSTAGHAQPSAPAQSAPAPSAATSAPTPVTGPRTAPAPQSSATVQSVLATAGAGLVAVAAVVFTYLNPDLADRALRSVIVGLITLLFLGGAWLLARRGLRFSAEAVGALGLVFAGLDIHAVAQLAAPEVHPWLTAAVITAVVAPAVRSAGRRRRIRVWQWVAVVALTLTPAMLGAAGGTSLSATAGALGVAFAGAAAIEFLRPPAPERVTLVATQVIASACALLLVWRIEIDDVSLFLLAVSGVLALGTAHALLAARQALTPLWAFVAGVTGATAIVLAVYAVPAVREIDASWQLAIVAAAASVALALVGTLVPLPRRVPRGLVAGGALTVFALPVVALVASAAVTGALTVAAFVGAAPWGDGPGITGVGTPLGLGVVSAGLGAFHLLARTRGGIVRLASPAARLSLAALAVSLLVLACGGLLVLPAAIAVLTVMVLAVAAVIRWMPARVAGRGVRAIMVASAHLALAAAVMVAWRDSAAVPIAGVATLVGLVALAAVQPPRWRFLHVAAGFSYALVVVATALGEGGVDGIARLCLTASAGLLVAIATTYLPAVGARSWQAVLVVSAVPFGIGVLQVLEERSGWTALSTGLMFVLALTLLLTRRPGLTVPVRTAAAAMLVPTLAVMVVCLGAQLLDSSGSPVALPIVAVLVGLALPASASVHDVLLRRGRSAFAADAARVATEASALLTGVIAIGLSVGREAAGLGTTLIVLLVIGFGAIAAGLFTARRYAWAVAGASFTGALWCVWGITGVDVFEAYLLPPALGAVVIAALLTIRGRRASALYSAGLLIAVGPILALIALAEPEATAGPSPVVWRSVGLLATAWALLALETTIGDGRAGIRRRRLRALRMPTLVAAGLAAIAGPIQGVRLGLAGDLPSLHGAGLFALCLGVSAVGAAALTLAAAGIRRAAGSESVLRRTRWLGAPAAVALAAGTWFAIERDWSSIWPMWMLMIAYLVATVVVAARTVRGATTAPPVWFLFAIAFVTAVVAWSPRDLRVEWFSLPLGAFLLVAGAIALRRTPDPLAEPLSTPRRATLDSWPGRWTGSWALLAPGIVTMMLASIVSTFTDPLTWRAILVMVLALAAILLGSRNRLAAPFLLGLIVLPIENVFVFSVQIGRGIESMPWWITLAVMGAVLLIIAVTAERRTGEAGTVAARMRDLR